MATELAKAYVQIIPSADGIKGKITSALGSEASIAGKGAGTTMAATAVASFSAVFVAGVLAAAAAAAAGIVTITKNAIEEGSSLEQSIGGIETLFGTGGQTIEEFAQKAGKSISEVTDDYNMLKEAQEFALNSASNAYKTAGLSANEYMETVTGFATSLKASTESELAAAKAADKAMIDMSDNANKMGTDMALIQNAYQGFAKQNYTMLDNLKLGYGGTKTEMERLLADAKELSGVEYNIDNLADVYEAIHVIQEDLGITGTTAKEASTTVAGSMASMKAAFSNVLGDLALGKDIGPSLDALGETVKTYLIDNLIPMAGNVLMQIPDLITGTTDMIAELLGTADTDSIITAGATLVEKFIMAIWESAPVLMESAGGLAESFIDSLGNIDADAAFDNLGTKITPMLEKATTWFENAADKIMAELPEAIEVIGGLINSYSAYAMERAPELMEMGKELILSLTDGLIEYGPDIQKAGTEVLHKLGATIGENLPEFLEAGSEIITELAVGILEKTPDLLMMFAVEIPYNISEAFGKYDWLSIGKNIIDGIASGIVNYAVNVQAAATDAASRALESVKTLLGIHSPSTAFAYVGEMIDRGLVEGVDNNAGLVTEAMHELSGSAFNAFTSAEYNLNTEQIKSADSYDTLADGMAEGLIRSRIAEKIAEIIDEKIGELTITVDGREFLRVEKSLA